MRRFNGQSFNGYASLLLTFHWLEFSHMDLSDPKGKQEMYYSLAVGSHEEWK